MITRILLVSLMCLSTQVSFAATKAEADTAATSAAILQSDTQTEYDNTDCAAFDVEYKIDEYMNLDNFDEGLVTSWQKSLYEIYEEGLSDAWWGSKHYGYGESHIRLALVHYNTANNSSDQRTKSIFFQDAINQYNKAVHDFDKAKGEFLSAIKDLKALAATIQGAIDNHDEGEDDE